MPTRRTVLASAALYPLAVTAAARAQDASPVPTRYPRANHPIIGSWQWTNWPDDNRYGPTTTFAIYTADGTYVETRNPRQVSIGTWRATGERAAELVNLEYTRASLDYLYEPGVAVLPGPFADIPGALVYRLAITVDETGNRITATGTVEGQDASGSILDNQVAYAGYAQRLVLASDSVGTPTS
jgi:hypothetical protein